MALEKANEFELNITIVAEPIEWISFVGSHEEPRLELHSARDVLLREELPVARHRAVEGAALGVDGEGDKRA